MTLSTIVIIIIILMLILYTIPAIPISVTTVIAVLMMTFFKAISFQEALSGFMSSAVFLVGGMMIIGRACSVTGVVGIISKKLFSFVKYGERTFIVIMCLIIALLSSVINAVAIIALMMPVLDDIAKKTNGKISRKMTYFPLGIASVMGTGLSSISSSSIITANQLLVNAGYEPLGVFAPAVINLPALIAIILLYATLGCKLQHKFFNFKEIPSVHDADDTEKDLVIWKMILAILVVVGTVVAILAGVNSGRAAFIGAVVVILTDCVGLKDAVKSVSWPTIIIVGASIGISAAMVNSGAAVILADKIIQLGSAWGTTTVGLCLILFLIGTIFSNVLAATSAVAIMMPIICSLCANYQLDIIPLTLACTSGTKFALATPVCTGAMTMIKIPGYRFWDYFRMGGLVNILCLLVTFAVIIIIY